MYLLYLVSHKKSIGIFCRQNSPKLLMAMTHRKKVGRQQTVVKMTI